jgi:uroporphyrinogen III methyltransferase/synthase
LVPERFVAESFAEALLAETESDRFLLAGASRGRQVLGEELERAGAQVDRIVVYSSVDVEDADPGVADALAAGEIDWVTITSSATARSLRRLYGDALEGVKVASISPVTTDALAQLGLDVTVEASPHSVPGLVEAILSNVPGRV